MSDLDASDVGSKLVVICSGFNLVAVVVVVVVTKDVPSYRPAQALGGVE